jgi:hypothetical protein
VLVLSRAATKEGALAPFSWPFIVARRRRPDGGDGERRCRNRPKPPIIIAQVAGSGTEGGGVKLPLL